MQKIQAVLLPETTTRTEKTTGCKILKQNLELRHPRYVCYI